MSEGKSGNLHKSEADVGYCVLNINKHRRRFHKYPEVFINSTAERPPSLSVSLAIASGTNRPQSRRFFDKCRMAKQKERGGKGRLQPASKKPPPLSADGAVIALFNDHGQKMNLNLELDTENDDSKDIVVEQEFPKA